ncbi:MAG TPA: hypothetical protein VFD88_11535 [Clostridia bacterium]|nr:hypothetical protein [Clostridia bacterium]
MTRGSETAIGIVEHVSSGITGLGWGDASGLSVGDGLEDGDGEGVDAK